MILFRLRMSMQSRVRFIISREYISHGKELNHSGTLWILPMDPMPCLCLEASFNVETFAKSRTNPLPALVLPFEGTKSVFEKRSMIDQDLESVFFKLLAMPIIDARLKVWKFFQKPTSAWLMSNATLGYKANAYCSRCFSCDGSF